jgi:WhiB family redox-sensing transcriptional regulator
MIASNDWMDFGACASSDGRSVRLMFPDGDDAAGVAAAKAICANCDVQGSCLKYALSRREKFGIWGGATEAERVSMLRHRQRAFRAEVVAREHGVLTLFDS